MGCVLAFAAGNFLCIALSDLLPELQFHQHDRLKLSAMLLLGIGMAYGLIYLESGGHDHHSHHAQAQQENREQKILQSAAGILKSNHSQ